MSKLSRMPVDSDVREYHRRREQAKKQDEAGPQLPTQFTPRNQRIKREKVSPEVDFKTRIANMSKAKAKTGLWIKKEGDIKKEKKVKKERRRKDSSSEDSEEEDRRITRKARKKLGLSVREYKLYCIILYALCSLTLKSIV